MWYLVWIWITIPKTRKIGPRSSQTATLGCVISQVSKMDLSPAQLIHLEPTQSCWVRSTLRPTKPNKAFQSQNHSLHSHFPSFPTLTTEALSLYPFFFFKAPFPQGETSSKLLFFPILPSLSSLTFSFTCKRRSSSCWRFPNLELIFVTTVKVQVQGIFIEVGDA